MEKKTREEIDLSQYGPVEEIKKLILLEQERKRKRAGRPATRSFCAGTKKREKEEAGWGKEGRTAGGGGGKGGKGREKREREGKEKSIKSGPCRVPSQTRGG